MAALVALQILYSFFVYKMYVTSVDFLCLAMSNNKLKHNWLAG